MHGSAETQCKHVQCAHVIYVGKSYNLDAVIRLPYSRAILWLQK